MKIQGLEQLTKQFEQLEKFSKEIDGLFGEVSFNPFDAESIEHAIVNMENLIDEKVQNYSSNSVIVELVANLKETYRSQILDKAAEARIEGSETDQDVK